MSVAGFTKIIQDDILAHINKYEESTRHEMNQEVTAMEISPELLKKNFTSIKSIARARELFETIRSIVKSSSYTKPFNPDDKDLGTGIKYTDKPGGSLLLIASNYNNLRRYLTANLSNDKRLLDTELGTQTAQLTDDEGELKFDNNGNPIIGTRSKFDIGHTVGFGLENKNAVAASRVFNALSAAGSTDTSYVRELYLKRFSDKHLPYKGSFDKTVDVTKNIVDSKISFIYTVMQESSVNQKLGAIEKKILTKLKKELLTGSGSKPVYTVMKDQYEDIFFGRKVKKYKSKTKVSGKRKPKKPKIKVKTNKGAGPIQQVSRDIKGRFQSIANLTALLQPLVQLKVKGNMDSASYFKTQTGRFTNSVKISGIRASAPDTLDIDYKYMSYPYAVFEEGGSHHQYGREPSTIINGSVRQAAVSLINSKFRLNIKDVS